MSMGGCDQAKGQIALASIGRLPEAERTSLDAHLDGCAECRAELADLSGLRTALASAELDSTDSAVTVPETLHTAVIGSLGTEVARHRRAVRVKFAAAAAVVLLAMGGTALATDAIVTSHPSPASPTYALSGPGGAHATARLTAESWGTSVDFRAYNQAAGQVLTVSMRTAGGSWWVAGTYRTVAGASVDVTMGCAIPVADIDAVRVTNSAGHQVLGGYDS
jgi:hypothetical protein